VAAVLAALVSALLLPAAAHAATAEVVTVPGPANSSLRYDHVHYVAAPGEANDLLVTFNLNEEQNGAEVTVRDRRAPVHAGSGCTAIDAHTAHCVGTDDLSPRIDATEAWLGNRADKLHTFRATPYPISGIRAHGGRGNDLLDGGPGPDRLDGGGGRDRLLGGRGWDVLNDGDRSGRSGPAGPGRDVLRGGPGAGDSVSYAQRARRVTVNVATNAPAGEKDERDSIAGLESATGGRGDDLLRGDGHQNTLRGGRGDDALIGRGGGYDIESVGDRLYGGPGRDGLRGGDGRDTVVPGKGRDERLSCGSGYDEVRDPEAGEVIGHCEQARFSPPAGSDTLDLLFPPRPVDFTRRALVFHLPCPRDGDGNRQRCSGTLSVRTASGRHQLLGHGSFRGLGSDERAVRVQLNRLGRKLFKRRRGVVATMRIRGTGIPSLAWTTELVRAR
jgi:Ca2+-binding RTX toxin-like protein